MSLPEICLRPETWSVEERPIASQSSPEGGLVLTDYRDSRTVRVHSLQWSFASAVEREAVLAIIPARIGAISARFNWTTPHGESVQVTVTQPPRVSRASHGIGSISLQLEEQLLERT